MPSRKSTKPADSATQVQALPIDEVHADPANARRHPERNKATIRASLARFGPGRSIVLDKNNVIRAGNGTIEEARQAGFDEVLVVEPKPNQLVAVKRADWSPSEATAYGIADNRSAELAEWDDVALTTTLRALQSEGVGIEDLGYSGDEVDLLLQRLAGELVDDPEGEWEGMPEFEHQDLTAVQSLHVHFKSREDVQAFAKLIGQEITEKTKWLWYPERERVAYGIVQESPLPDLHHIEGEMGTASHQQSP